MNVGADKPALPADGAIQIAFDRYLLPSTVIRQSFAILDSANQALAPELAPLPIYDPIARTVTLVPQKPLTPGQTYKLVLGIPKEDADLGGFRAIDRAKLYADQPLEFPFLVGPPTMAQYEPPVTFCRDVLPIFTAKCNIPTCHGNGTAAAASLILDTSAGVSATALNRIAQGSNTGGRSTSPPAPGRLFGVDMPIIDPGNPGNSWLMYKIDLAPLPTSTTPADKFVCTNGLKEPELKFQFAPLVPQAQRATDDIERSILSDFILGREMPFPVPQVGGYGDEPLTFDEREIVRIWIKSLVPGAAPPECGGCGILPSGDAGPKDASVADTSMPPGMDAGTDADTDAGDAADQ